MGVLKVKVVSLPYIFQVLYVLCFTRPRYQVSVYRTIGPLVYVSTWFVFFQVLSQNTPGNWYQLLDFTVQSDSSPQSVLVCQLYKRGEV